MAGRFQQQLDVVVTGGADGEPAVAVAEWDILASFEPEHLGVEVQRPFLVVDVHAGQLDAQGHLDSPEDRVDPYLKSRQGFGGTTQLGEP